jgi:hypothetical protein
VRTDGTLAVRALAGAEASPEDAHTVRLRMRDDAKIDLVVDPPGARLEVGLRKDGVPLRPGQLLVGPFGLPLLGSAPSAVFASERLSWLDAERAPVIGKRGDVLLWRDPSRLASLDEGARETGGEVDAMMQRWGYAQPGAAKGRNVTR